MLVTLPEMTLCTIPDQNEAWLDPSDVTLYIIPDRNDAWLVSSHPNSIDPQIACAHESPRCPPVHGIGSITKTCGTTDIYNYNLIRR